TRIPTITIARILARTITEILAKVTEDTLAQMLELPKLSEIPKIPTAKLIPVDEKKDSQVYQVEDVESN
ncbi:466_t:CDS:1, partial [Cetraspora pellucida]